MGLGLLGVEGGNGQGRSFASRGYGTLRRTARRLTRRQRNIPALRLDFRRDTGRQLDTSYLLALVVLEDDNHAGQEQKATQCTRRNQHRPLRWLLGRTSTLRRKTRSVCLS